MKIFLITNFLLCFMISNAMAITKIDISVNVLINENKILGEAKIYDYDKNPQIDPTGIEIIDKELKRQNNKEFIILKFQKNISENTYISNDPTSSRFVTLFDNWFPKLNEYSIYNLTVVVPDGYIPISEADKIITNKNEYKFIFEYPRKDMSLIVGKFVIQNELYKDIEILTYFLKTENELSNTYIRQIKNYIDKYEAILGKFPFKRFAVVENPQQTGYGFPTYTLLGSAVIRLPFIPFTSLGHEFVHNWFGNCIYNDFSKGNWVEGLTTYFSDYLYEKEKNNDIEYRKNIITKYLSYNENEQYSLMDFRYNIDRKWEGIGYGKGMFLFYTLERIMGEKEFNQAIREFIKNFSFKEADWKDIQEIFQKYSNNDLKDIFDQFLNRKDIPDIDVSNIKLEIDEKGEFIVKFNISQKNVIPYKLSLPIEVETITGKKFYDIKITEKNTEIILNTVDLPLKLIIDSKYEVMRRLTPKEFPPILHRIFGANKGIIALKSDEKELYSDVLQTLNSINKNYSLIEWNNEKPFDLGKNKDYPSIIFLGTIPNNVNKIIPDKNISDIDVSINTTENFYNNGVILHIKINKKEAFHKIARRYWHFGQYSNITFSNGNIIEKNTLKMENGIINNITNNINIFTKDNIKNFNTFIDEIKNKDAILIGEQHDKYEHHLAQLIIIKTLHKKGYNIAVGMEMFQEPFQNALDKYLANEISEVEFLVQSEYFKRWGFDYKFYKPIIDYCKANNIKIIALNTPSELTRKISKDGLSAFTIQELEKIPFLDTSNYNYMEYLKDFFHKSHSFDTKQDFSNFYLAQLLWDETMAENSYNFLKKNPYHKLIILAGNGHIDYYYGIPDRLKRRGISNIVTISNYSQGEMDLRRADYILIMPSIESPWTPRLGVTLEPKDDGLLIKEVEKNSIADKSNLLKDDIILSIDNINTPDIDTLKAILSTRKLNDTVKVRIKRKSTELEITTVPFFRSSPHQFIHPK